MRLHRLSMALPSYLQRVAELAEGLETERSDSSLSARIAVHGAPTQMRRATIVNKPNLSRHERNRRALIGRSRTLIWPRWTGRPLRPCHLEVRQVCTWARKSLLWNAIKHYETRPPATQSQINVQSRTNLDRPRKLSKSDLAVIHSPKSRFPGREDNLGSSDTHVVSRMQVLDP